MHDLRLVVEVPTEGGRADAGCPEQLRGAQGVGRDDDRRRVDLVDLAGLQVASRDAENAVALPCAPP